VGAFESALRAHGVPVWPVGTVEAAVTGAPIVVRA
jgi:hypothetical protein